MVVLDPRIQAWLDRDPEPQRMAVVRRGEREPIPRFIRRLVHKRDGWKCQHCGDSPIAASATRRADMLHVDHVVPWSAGGSDRTNNLRTLCRSCNEKRSNFEDADVADVRPMPIVRVCAPCEGTARDIPANPIEVYCGSRDHVSWSVTLERLL